MKMIADLKSLKAHSERMDAIEFAFAAYPGSFERFFMRHPLPSWIKDERGRMVLSNRAYETAYDIPPLEYAGTFDGDQWPEEEAEGFGELDVRAREDNKLVIGVEWITLPSVGKRQALFVTKWPVRWDDKGRPTHIAGSVVGAVTLHDTGGENDGRT